MKYQDFVAFTQNLQKHVKDLAKSPDKYPSENTLKLQAKYLKLYSNLFFDEMSLYTDEMNIAIAKGQLTAMGLDKYAATNLIGSNTLDKKNIETFYKNIEKIDIDKLSIGYDYDHVQEYVDNLEKQGLFKDELDENGNFKKIEDLDIGVVEASSVKHRKLKDRMDNPFFEHRRDIDQELENNAVLKDRLFGKKGVINKDTVSGITTKNLLQEVDAIKDKIIYKDVLKTDKIKEIDDVRIKPYLNLIRDLQKTHNARPWYQRFFGYFGEVGKENDKIKELKNELVKLGGGTFKEIDKAINASDKDYVTESYKICKTINTSFKTKYPSVDNDHVKDVSEDLLDIINNEASKDKDLAKENAITNQKDLVEDLGKKTGEKEVIVNNKIEAPTVNEPNKELNV